MGTDIVIEKWACDNLRDCDNQSLYLQGEFKEDIKKLKKLIREEIKNADK